MKMGNTNFIFFIIFFTLSLVSMLRADDDAQENHLFGFKEIEIDEMIEGFENELKKEDVLGRFKEEANDGGQSSDSDSLSSLLRSIVTPEFLEGKLQSNKTCTTCHRLLEEIAKAVGDTDKQFAIIKSLLEKCENQTIFDDCKDFVFAYAPLILNSVHKFVAMDLCHMIGICSVPKNQTSQEFDHYSGGKIEPYSLNPGRKMRLP